jgi:glutamyl-tRNA synthetase
MSHQNTDQKQVRVRFAPSPTGFLHIGGVRTALFNWLYARHFGGKFLVRIEDTDLERSETRFTDDILSSMKWLGLDFDEELIYQSKRLGVYLEKAEQLIKEGKAYRCYCTEAEIEQMRTDATAKGAKPMYNRRCRNKNETKPGPYVIRAAIPLDGYVEFDDLIRGPIRFENTEIDDFVLIRSNGAPTYNLSVVVDDVFSQMTHIIRGDDHINNTPKQIHLYRFFGFEVPKFAHLSMILGADKKKLSKRHGAVSANYYRGEGYLPEALLNFLARLGWSHGDQEVFSLEEMKNLFDFDHVQKSGAVFNSEKLLWLNGHYIRESKPERLQKILISDFSEHISKEVLPRLNTELGARIVGLVQPKVKLMKEMIEQVVPLCTTGAVEVTGVEMKINKDPAVKTAVKAAVVRAHGKLSQLVLGKTSSTRGAESPWGASVSLEEVGVGHVEIDAILRQIAEESGVKLGVMMEPLRLAVTGRLVSAGLFELLTILPWDVVDARLKKVQEICVI